MSHTISLAVMEKALSAKAIELFHNQTCIYMRHHAMISKKRYRCIATRHFNRKLFWLNDAIWRVGYCGFSFIVSSNSVIFYSNDAIYHSQKRKYRYTSYVLYTVTEWKCCIDIKPVPDRQLGHWHLQICVLLIISKSMHWYVHNPR